MTTQLETSVRPLLDELVHWINTLKAAGVSADKAAEVASNFFLVSCGEEGDDDEDEYDYDEDETN